MRPGISSLIHDTVLVEYPSLRGIRVWPRFCGLLFEECSTPKPKVWRESRPPHAPVRIQHQLHAFEAHAHLDLPIFTNTTSTFWAEFLSQSASVLLGELHVSTSKGKGTRVTSMQEVVKRLAQ